MELEPATLDQIERSRNGKMVVIENDVGFIVKQIKEIDNRLHVRYSEAGEYFVVYWKNQANEDKLVLTAKELDGRVVRRLQKLNSSEYNYLDEIEKLDAAAAKAADDRQKERLGDLSERLSHAIRKDLGIWKDSARSKQSWGKGIAGH